MECSGTLLPKGLQAAAQVGLPLAFTFNLFKPCSENFHLLDKHLDNRLLLFKQRLAVGAIGGDLGNVHDPQILFDSARFHQDRFSRPVNKYLLA